MGTKVRAESWSDSNTGGGVENGVWRILTCHLPFLSTLPSNFTHHKLPLWKQQVDLRARRKCNMSVPPVQRAAMFRHFEVSWSVRVPSCCSPGKPWRWKSHWYLLKGFLTGHWGQFCWFLWAKQLPQGAGRSPLPACGWLHWLLVACRLDSVFSLLDAKLPVFCSRSAVVLVLPGDTPVVCASYWTSARQALSSLTCHIPFLFIASVVYLRDFF